MDADALVARPAGGAARRRDRARAEHRQPADDLCRAPDALERRRARCATVPICNSPLLIELTAVDFWPQRAAFLKSSICSCPSRTRHRLRAEGARCTATDAHVATVSSVWPAANWLEREVWDLFGIVLRRPSRSAPAADARGLGGLSAAQGLSGQVSVAVRTTEPMQVTGGGVPREPREGSPVEAAVSEAARDRRR